MAKYTHGYPVLQYGVVDSNNDMYINSYGASGSYVPSVTNQWVSVTEARDTEININYDNLTNTLHIEAQGQHHKISARELKSGRQYRMRVANPYVDDCSCMSKDEYDRREKIEKEKNKAEQLAKDKKRRDICSEHLWKP